MKDEFDDLTEHRTLRKGGYWTLLSPLRFTKFLSIGAVGALVDNAVLVGFVELLAIEPVLAAVGAKELSIIVMFVLNERWTFGDVIGGGRRTQLWRLVKSNTVRSGGAAVGITVLYLLTTWLDVWYLVANVLGIGVGFIFNYTLESVLTWQVHHSK